MRVEGEGLSRMRSALVYRGGTALPNPVVTLNTDGTQERGVLGIALDPSFATNGFLYVSYTTVDDHALLSRLTVHNDTAALASEKVLFRGNQLQNPHHGANDLHVGPDGKLWWSVGDNVPSISNAQALTNIYGKILRFNPDGSIPAGGITASATAGLFVCSHNPPTTGSATFDNVAFTPGP